MNYGATFRFEYDCRSDECARPNGQSGAYVCLISPTYGQSCIVPPLLAAERRRPNLPARLRTERALVS